MSPGGTLQAHLIGEEEYSGTNQTSPPRYDWSVMPPGAVQGMSNPAGRVASTNHAPVQAMPFTAFAPKVNVRWDERFLFVESDGMPTHGMMVGITNWQQQVPLPQSYFGDNAWRIPLIPIISKDPATIKNHFLRGAIAIAANGIPIFNPQNNRGEIAQEIGELDQWGGHCGRADDYHYHAAPLHLQSVLGTGMPIAYALDGYPIYGLTEPDGSAPKGLDAFNGHDTPSLGYHYHASTHYPYVNGGFHGEVVEKDGQVDPQPRASSVRGAGLPLRGATITGFESMGTNSYKLSYEVNGDARSILYGIKPDGTFPFEYRNGREGTTNAVYTSREGREMKGKDGGQQGPPDEARRPRPDGGESSGKKADEKHEGRPPEPSAGPVPQFLNPSKSGVIVLSSPVVTDGGSYPIEFTGDGAGISPPLAWSGTPAGTKSLAIIMHHLDPEGKTKIYWTLFNIPPETTQLNKNAHGIGTLGLNSINRRTGYAPPHSQGPGPKNYIITLYALSEPLQINVSPDAVTADLLLTAMKDRIIANSDLHVVSTREIKPGENPQPDERRRGQAPPPPR